jgi:hypothetical protein
MGVIMMSTLRNASDTVTTSVGDAVEAVRGQIDSVTGQRRQTSRRRRGSLLVVVVAVGVMAWRAWSRHNAQEADDKNIDATGDGRGENLRKSNGGAGKAANADMHNAHMAGTDDAHSDTQSTS